MNFPKQNWVVFFFLSFWAVPLTSISKGHCAPSESLSVTTTGFLKPFSVKAAVLPHAVLILLVFGDQDF